MSNDRSSVRSSLHSHRSHDQNISATRELFNEFNKKTPRKMSKNEQFIENIDVNLAYKQLRLGIIKEAETTEEILAATVIQRAVRRYLTKRKFVTFVHTYHYLIRRAFSIYYYIFALNGTNNNKLRRHFFECQKMRMINGRHLKRNRIQLNWEQFNIIGLLTIDKRMDPERLCKFVKCMYKEDMRRMLLEWLIVVRKEKQKRKYLSDFRFARSAWKEFRLMIVPFKLWLYRYKRVIPSEEDINNYPEVANYAKCLKYTEKMNHFADDMFKSTLKKRVLSTLHTNRIQKITYAQVLENSDKFALKKTQQYALRAWTKVVSSKKEIYTSKLYAMKKWRNYYESKKHTRLLITIYHNRTDFYLKLTALNAILFNMKNKRIMNANMYIKIQAKPSLALAFIHLIRGDNDSSDLAIAMHGWVQYVRRRKKWQQFITKNTLETEHNVTKQKVLCAFRRKKFITKGFGFNNPYFQHRTYQLYQNVMKSEGDSEPFLIVEGDTSLLVEDIISKAKTNRDQREAFFKAWRLIPQDYSLLMRLAIINMTKKRNNEELVNVSERKRTEISFQKAVANFKALNLASDDKFSFVINEIKNNNVKALRNRTNITIRDSIIVTSHESHESAIKMHKINPQFQNISKLKPIKKNDKACVNLRNEFEPLVDIASLGSRFTSPNLEDFTNFKRLKVSAPWFNKQLNEIRSIIMMERQRSEINSEITKRYDRLLFSNDREYAQKNFKTETTIDPFSETSKKIVPTVKRSEIKPKYANFFKQHVYVSKRRDNETNTKKLKSTTKENISLTEADAERLRLSGLDSKSQLSIELGTKSSFFSNLSSFANMMKETATKFKNLSNSLSSTNSILCEEVTSSNKVEEEEYEEEFMKDERNPEKRTVSHEEKKVKEIIGSGAGIVKGFNKEIMTSASDTSNIKDQDVNSKYKQFLEILFGKQKKDQPTVQQANVIKRKIINEYRNRKAGAPGITTNGITMPVTSLVEEYRSERRKNKSKEADAAILRIKEKERKRRESEGQKEYQCKYNGRRYYWNQDNFEEEEEEKIDSFREDLMEMENQNEINNEEIEEEEEEKEEKVIRDKDFDAAAYEEEEDEELSDDEIKYFPSLDIKLPRTPSKAGHKKAFVDNGLAMKSVNKVVFKMINNMVRSDDSNIKLVETDEDRMPSLDLSTIQSISRDQSKESVGKVQQVHKPKRVIRQLPPKSGKPTVIPSMNIISPEMATIMREDETLTKTIYDNGEMRVMKGSFKPVQQTKQKKFNFTGAPPALSTGFIDGQVVSFASGSRGLTQKPHNFTNLRITATKQRGITKPVVGQIQHVAALRPATTIQKQKENVSPVYGMLIDIAGELSEKDNEKFKKFSARVRSMRKSSALAPVVEKSPEDINKPQFQHKIQSMYVSLATDQDAEKTADDLIKIAQEKPAFLGVLQRAVSQVSNENKTRRTMELKKKKEEKENQKKTTKEMASKFVDLSWMQIDTNYKAVALQFADTENNDLDAIIAPTYEDESPKKRSRRAKTAISKKPNNWDDVIRGYDLNEMMLVTPCN